MKQYSVKFIKRALRKAEGFPHHKEFPMSLAWTCVHDLLKHYLVVIRMLDIRAKDLDKRRAAFLNKPQPLPRRTAWPQDIG